MVLPDLLRRHGGETDAVLDGAVVPRLPDAEAVHLVHLHVRDHLRRRDGDQVDVAIGMDAARCEPVAQPHRVRAGRKRHRKGQRIAGGLGLFRQRLDLCGGARTDSLQLVVEGDRLPVAIEQPWDHHRLHRRTRQPHRRGERHAEEHVRGVVLTQRQLVADDGPRRFLRDGGVDAELLEVAELVRDHDRRAVGQRDDAEAKVRVARVRPRRRHRRSIREGRPERSTAAVDAAVSRNARRVFLESIVICLFLRQEHVGQHHERSAVGLAGSGLFEKGTR